MGASGSRRRQAGARHDRREYAERRAGDGVARGERGHQALRVRHQLSRTPQVLAATTRQDDDSVEERAMQLQGKTFLVTGGGSGLGAACVRELAGAGANVVIADVNAETGEKLASE